VTPEKDVQRFHHTKKGPRLASQRPGKSGREERHADRKPRDERRLNQMADHSRRSHLQFERIFGKHSVEAVLLRRPKAVRRLLIAGRESYYERIITECKRRNIQVETVPWPEFMRLGQFTESEKHQGILAFVTPMPIFGDRDIDRLKIASRIVALDQVSNPQNLAAILRSASFFHTDAVVLMRHRSADITPEVQRLAVGGAEFADIYKITNLADTIDELKEFGFRVFGLDERGEKTLAQTQFPEKTVLVVGAEGEGLRRKTREHCDELIRIPGGRPAVESLNASIAATIALYELCRLRN
jgi:23S rRNA (guanosine2251-2'-O)-methyltransferase